MTERLTGVPPRRKPLTPPQQAEAARLMLAYLRREIDRAALEDGLPGQREAAE